MRTIALEASGASAIVVLAGYSGLGWLQMNDVLAPARLGASPPVPLLLAAGALASALAVWREGIRALILTALLLALEPLLRLLYGYAYFWECLRGLTSVCGLTPELGGFLARWPLGIGFLGGLPLGMALRRGNTEERVSRTLVAFGIYSLASLVAAYVTFAWPYVSGSDVITPGTRLASLAVSWAGAVVAGLYLARGHAGWRGAGLLALLLLASFAPAFVAAGGLSANWSNVPIDVWSAPSGAAVLVVMTVARYPWRWLSQAARLVRLSPPP